MLTLNLALMRRTLLRLLRSGAAGILATITDTGTLMLLVKFAGMNPVVAGIYSLILGSIVMFVASKYFVFEVRTTKTLFREAVLYAAVQVGGIGVSTWLYKIALALSPFLQDHYVIARLGVNNVAWLLYFFPLWHFVFKTPPKGPIL